MNLKSEKFRPTYSLSWPMLVRFRVIGNSGETSSCSSEGSGIGLYTLSFPVTEPSSLNPVSLVTAATLHIYEIISGYKHATQLYSQ